jgi:hypothetical protein
MNTYIHTSNATYDHPPTASASVFDRLTTPSKNEKQQQSKREEEKLMRELAECTFAPKLVATTTPVAKAVLQGTDAARSPTNGGGPVWERLYRVSAPLSVCLCFFVCVGHVQYSRTSCRECIRVWNCLCVYVLTRVYDCGG